MSSPSSHRPLLIIFVTVFIDLLGFGIVLPLLPRYGEHFNAGGLQLGLLLSSFSAMQFLFAPLWGRLSDRIGRRPVLIVGLFGSMSSYALFGVATSLGKDGTLLGLGALSWLFITRIGAGIAGATISTAQAYIADSTSPRERARGMALIGAAFGIGFTFGPVLGAMFVPDEPAAARSVQTETIHGSEVPSVPAEASTPPPAAPGYLAAGLSALAMLSAIFMLPESLRPGSTAPRSGWLSLSHFSEAFSRRFIGLILAAIFLTTFAFAQFESTLSLLTEHLGLGLRQNFYVFGYVGLVLTLAQGLLVRRLVPRIGEFHMGLTGVLLMTIGLALIGVSARFSSLTLLIAVITVAVVGFACTTPSLQAMLSLNTEETEQGGVLGVGQSMSALARILGPFVGLVLQKKVGTAVPYWSAAAIMAVSTLLLLPLRRAGTSSRHHETPVPLPTEF